MEGETIEGKNPGQDDVAALDVQAEEPKAGSEEVLPAGDKSGPEPAVKRKVERVIKMCTHSLNCLLI